MCDPMMPKEFLKVVNLTQNFILILTGEAIYLTGNSLGLQPRSLEETLQTELNSWKKWGVQGHFRGPNPWVSVDEV